MILLRLSPLIPYNALDYMSGITSISLLAYCLALIGILPGTILFCFLGATASSLTESTSSKHEVVRIISLVFGLVFAIFGVAVASYYSKVELNKVRREGVCLLLLHAFFRQLEDFSTHNIDIRNRESIRAS
jgi:uncharacterized membrane protein YdjX (TVP38/TMEM64 family)